MDHPTAVRSELPLLENALLWAMRAWVVGQNRNRNITGRITRMFGSLNAPEAAFQLDGFMRDLRLGAKRILNIDCVCQPGFSTDETLLLDMFALLQEAHEDEAITLLGRLIQTGTVASAHCHALALTLCLNAAGHYLPRGAETVRRHAFCHLIPGYVQLPGRLRYN